MNETYDTTTTTLAGRVEVKVRGSADDFGTVCSNIWTDAEATVVCRALIDGFVKYYMFFLPFFV